MTQIRTGPSLTQQVYDAIANEIFDGALPAGAHLVQEQLAERFGVSRQPIQQAMALLKADGMVAEIGRRGLHVTPLDLDLMRHHYDIRAVLDGLAARGAAQRCRDDAATARDLAERGGKILKLGETAVRNGAVGDQVRHDAEFHGLIYEGSGNPLLDRAAEPHWRFLRRAMSDVLRHAQLPDEIWRQHAEILQAVTAGQPERAEELMMRHDLDAAGALETALRRRPDEAPESKKTP